MKLSFRQTSYKSSLPFSSTVLLPILALMLSFNLRGFSQDMSHHFAMNVNEVTFASVDNNMNVNANLFEETGVDSQDELNDSDLVDLDEDLADLESEVGSANEDQSELNELMLESTDHMLESEEEMEELEYEISDLELEEEMIGMEEDNDSDLLDIINDQNQTIENQANELEKAQEEIEGLKALLEHTDLDLINND